MFDHLAGGGLAIATDEDGVSLIQWCAYYGDVSAIRLLMSNGAALQTLGDDYGLSTASFHGHWRLCQFLLENGAKVNEAASDTGETPLHSALCTTRRVNHNVVMKVLLAHGADPNAKTKPGVETGSFMRDCRTKGETPLHRAAAFGDADAIQLLLKAGALIDAKDANGDSPLSWASWYLRPASILRMLCYGPFCIRPEYAGMEANLQGGPPA